MTDTGVSDETAAGSTLDIAVQASGVHSVSILTSNGQVVTTRSGHGPRNYAIAMKNLPKGLLVVALRNNGTTAVQKILNK